MFRLGLTTLETAILVSVVAIAAAIMLSMLSSANLNVQKQKGLLEILYAFPGDCGEILKVKEFVNTIYGSKKIAVISLSDGCKECRSIILLVRVVASGTFSSLKLVTVNGAEMLTPRRPQVLTPGYYAFCISYKEKLGEIVLREVKVPNFVTIIVLAPQGPVIYR